MKKGWKIFWIVCGAIAVIGLGFCITGAAMGVTAASFNQAFEDNFRHNDWDYVYDWDDDSDWDDESDWDDNTDLVDTDDWDDEVESNAAQTYVPGSKEYISEFSQIQEIDLDVTYVEVDVRPYSGDTITVDKSGLRSELQNKLSCTTEGHELKIESKNHSVWRKSGKNDAGKIVIQIPKDLAFTEASFDIGAGKLEIDSLKAGDLSINVGAGLAKVKKIEAGNLDAECGAGQLLIDGTVSAGAEFDCGVGEMKASLTGNEDEFDYRLKCGIGQIEVSNNSYSGLGSKKNIDNGTGRILDINCGIGNVTVTFDGK